MSITNTGHFGITTIPTDRPEGRGWGTHHWRFVIIGEESGSVYSGVYSAGANKTPEHLHVDVLRSVAMDATLALEGEGDMVTTLEAIDDEGLGYGAAEAYKLARDLVVVHDWVVLLTDDEREALENAQYDEIEEG